MPWRASGSPACEILVLLIEPGEPSAVLSASRRTFSPFSTTPDGIGLEQRSGGLEPGVSANSCVGNVPVAMMTGSYMRAARSFLSSSTPVSLGMLLSVINRS